MRINTNIASLNAQANNAQTNMTLQASLEKLSSGLKINKAADDASGMAIADKLRTQASSIGQGIQNANSGSALITIADKAMSEQSNILDIVKTKLLQASTSTTSAEGREAIRKDIKKLLDQVNNISEQTTYNGVNLLNNKGADFNFQIGEKSTDVIGLTTAYAVNTEGLGSSDREFANSATITSGTFGGEITNLALEGEASDAKINVKSSAGTMGVTFTSAGGGVEISGKGVTQLTGAEGMIVKTDNAEDIAFLNKQAADTSDALTKLADGVYSLSGASITFASGASHDFKALTVTSSTAAGSFSMASATEASIKKIGGTADINITGALEAVTDGDSAEGIAFGGIVMVKEGTMAIHADAPATNGAVAINTVVASSSGSVSSLEVSIASEEKVTSLSLKNSTSSMSQVTLSTTDGDTAKALEDAGLTKSADGTYQWSATSTGGTLNFAGSGIQISNLTVTGLDKTTSGTEKLFVATQGGVTVENLVEVSGNTRSDQNSIGIQVSTLPDGKVSAASLSATGFSASTVSSGLGASQLSGLASLGEGKLTTETANNFMSVIDDAMTQLNTVRSDFGSTQNQMSAAVRNMMVTQVNIKAAESIIRDVDYAAESANFNKQNIISQAGTYAMSQANNIQQNVMKLLQ